MKRFVFSLASFCVLCLFTSFQPADGWTALLKDGLKGWDTYLSYRHKVTYNGQVPKNAKGEPMPPIGYNKDDSNVFSVNRENGEPVLRISGEIYGCVISKKEYQNYHLKLKVKWGDKKWNPRLNEPKDSGILYHSQGECGADYFRSWMLLQEFQILEAGMGDYWCIANSQIDIRASKPRGRDTLVYNRNAGNVRMGSEGIGGFCQAADNFEKPAGEWNELELICFNGKSLHIVNGHVAMALSNSGYVEGQIMRPLLKGKIQLQSEAAEVFFKDILIRDIQKMPKEYQAYFN